MSYIDLAIILLFLLYVFLDFQRGFLRLMADLIGLAISFVTAIAFYTSLADFLVNRFNLSVISAKPISFLAIWFLVQGVFFGISKIISFYTPATIKQSSINRYLGILPAMVKAAIFIAVLMILIVMMPLNQKTKNLFTDSYFGQKILKYTINIENQLEKVFGSQSGNLTLVTDQNQQSDNTPLGFSTTQMEINEEAEKVMLEKINEERAKIGVSPVAADTLVRNVARIHSRDMFIRGYFSHQSADGKNLFDRLVASNVNFQAAAENIALAPNANLAHLGLMGSEKHRQNILDPSFTRVGIGVMENEQYGIIVTQDFVK